MREEPIWHDAKKKDDYSLTGLMTCKENLFDFERVSTIQIIRYYTQADGAHIYGVVVWFTDGTFRDISTSVGAALQREFSWTIDKLRTSWAPLELGRNLVERMALPQAQQGEYERDWSLQPPPYLMIELWRRVRVFDAYDED